MNLWNSFRPVTQQTSLIADNAETRPLKKENMRWLTERRMPNKNVILLITKLSQAMTMTMTISLNMPGK